MSETVAGYEIERELGRGAEGVVYLARSPGVGKPVALKVFGPEHQARYARALETYRAVEALRRKGHDARHLAEGLAAGELEDGGGYLALAYQPSGSLAELVKASGPLSPARVVSLVDQILRGLEALHAAELCHRDVKPGNVLLDDQGRAILGDFGLVSGREATLSSGGTPAFAAPEQWSVDDSQPGGARREGVPIDVYGAGATAYYLLTGRSPLPGAPDVFQLEASGVPRRLQAVLLRALSLRPEDRYPTAAAFRSALGVSLQPPEPPDPDDPFGELTRPQALALALLVLLVAGASLYVGGKREVLPIRTPSSAPALPTSSPRPTDAPPARETPAASQTTTPPPETPALAASRPPTTTQVKVEGAEVRLVTPEGERPLRRYARGPVAAVALGEGRFVCAGESVGGPRLDFVDGAGEVEGGHDLPAFAERLTALPDGRVAFATEAGEVWVAGAESAPRQVARFAHAVVALFVRGGRLVARGDQRQLRELGPEEDPRPDELLIEGAFQRYALPSAPRIEERLVPYE